MSKVFAPLSELYDLNRWVRFECGQAGVSVQFDPDAVGPYTTRNTIVLPALRSDMTMDDAIKLRAYVVHELAHHIHGPDVFSIMEKNGLTMDSTPITTLLNMIEDGRIERAAARAYKGDAVALSAGRRLISEFENNNLEQAIKASGGLASLDPTAKRFLAMMVADSRSREDWDIGTGIGKADMIRTSMSDPEVAELVRKLEAMDYTHRDRALKNTDDAFEMAKDAFKILFDSDPDEEIKQAKQKAKAAGEGEGKPGEGKPGKGKGGAGKGGEYDRNKPGEPGTMSATTKVIAKNLVLQSDSPDNKRNEGESHGNGMGLDFSSYTPTRTFSFIPPERIEVVDFTKTPAKPHYWTPVKATGGFAERVRRLIQVRAATRYEGGYKSGKLHMKNLYRFAMPADLVSEDYRTRVFRKKVENDTLDVCISLLVDCSGSMGGEKFQHAVHAASQMEHAFGRVLRIPTEVLGHTTSMSHGNGLRMYNVKPFASTVSEEHITNSFGSVAGSLWGNADADAIWYTYGRILKQKAKRKIIIVLSDGSPADGAEGADPYYGLKETVAQIERDSRATGVEIYGIGIRDTNVKHFYSHHVVIHRADEIENKLIDLLGSIVLKTNKV